MVETIKVYPGKDGEGMKHPVTGVMVKPGGSPWPSDQFTHRRIGDGSILTTAGGGVTSDVGAERRKIIDQKLAAAKK